MARVGAAACVFLVLLTGSTRAIYTTVGAGSSKCFFEQLDEGDQFVGQFEESSGQGSIDATITSPSGSTLFSVSNKNEGEFDVKAAAKGVHKLCFGNLASGSGKIVSFATHVGEHPPHRAATRRHTQALERKTFDILTAVRSLNEEQRFTRTRERLHDAVTESLNSRVVWFSVLELVTVVTVAYWQLRSLKSFFEVRASV